MVNYKISIRSRLPVVEISRKYLPVPSYVTLQMGLDFIEFHTQNILLK